MEWNAESVLDALNDFERKSEIPEILDQYLERIAKNGEIVFPWNKLKPLLKKKLEFVLDEFYETCPVETSVPVPNFETFNFDNLKKTILQAVDAFTSAPFTIQRLCELVTNPTKHYNRTDKYMRGIEKNVLVVSTVEPRSEQGDNANNPVVNGMPNDSPRDDNDTNGHESPDSVSSSNLNTPSNHVLLENFANVFPSAVCIPPSTDISVDSDVDNNFMENPEQELAPVERIAGAGAPPKEEEMDTQEDEQSDKEQDMAAEESSNTTDSENLSDDPLTPAVVEGDDTIENSPSEAVCSVETDTIPESKPAESQQDDTVSQSDDNSQTSNEESTEVPEESIEVADYINEDVINKLDDYINKVGDVINGDEVPVPLKVDAPIEIATDVPESISTTEPTEHSMDSESTGPDAPEHCMASTEPNAPV